MASGYENLEKYLETGARQSLFHKENEKRWIWNAYQSYLNVINGVGKNGVGKKHGEGEIIHSAFTPIPISGQQYDAVCIDEAQNFSFAQLKSYCGLCRGNDIHVFLDENQSRDNIPKIKFLKYILTDKTKLKVKLHEMNEIIRCAPAIIHEANLILGLKAFAAEGCVWDENVKIRGMLNEMQTGTVKWLTPKIDADFEQLKNLMKLPHVALITLPEFIEQAKKDFPGAPLIFTTESSAGLQFNEVILYRLLDGEKDKTVLKEINQRLSKEKDIRASIEKYKNRQPRERTTKSDLILKEIYTACTRAMTTLYFGQNEHHDIEYITGFLKLCLTKQNDVALNIEDESSLLIKEQKRVAEWLETADELYRKSKWEPLKGVLENKLKYSDEQIIEFLTSYDNVEKTNAYLAANQPVDNPKKKKRKKPKPKPVPQLIEVQSPIEPQPMIEVQSPITIQPKLLKREEPEPKVKQEKRAVKSTAPSIDFSTVVSSSDPFSLCASKEEITYLTRVLNKANIVDDLCAILDNKIACKWLFAIEIPWKGKGQKQRSLSVSQYIMLDSVKSGVFLDHFREMGGIMHSLQNPPVILQSLAEILKLPLTPFNQKILENLAKNKIQEAVFLETVWFYAAAFGDIKTIEYLENKIDRNVVNKNGLTALVVAVLKGQIDIVQYLFPKMKNTNVNQLINGSLTFLLLAVNKGHVSLIKFLLQHPDLDINLVDSRGHTPLLAAIHNGYFDIVDLLLKQKNIDVNKANHKGMTPLFEGSQIETSTS